MRPELQPIDWLVIGLYCVGALVIGSLFTRKASKGVESFFVGDRKLPWWVAGTSIVATTFAADTPLAITGLVASGGIAGNWIWWCWAIAHVCATFFFARLWRRANVITDAEVTELRYGGRPAAVLRGFKAVYFGVFINGLTMAWVIAAMVKISRAFFDVDPSLVIITCVGFSVLYTSLGGFRSVVFTDLAQFALGMVGAIVLAVFAVNHFGGIGEVGGGGMLGELSAVSAAAQREVRATLAFVPDADHPTTPLLYFVVLLIAGWWRYAEGNGYIVQRLAACRDENEAQGASLWFAMAHNALRPWPWLLVGLAALAIYPQLPPSFPHPSLSSPAGEVTVEPAQIDPVVGGELTITSERSLHTIQIGAHSFELTSTGNHAYRATIPGGLPQGLAITTVHGPQGSVRVGELGVTLQDREMAYPLLMGKFLPTGLLGLVIASLLAAFMSTVDTHTNWGASYLVRDLYQRFLRPHASEAHYVMVSRLCILLIAIVAGITALFIQNIGEVWRFLITLGAGLGSVTAARWYWWRVTPHAEFAALGVTTLLALGFLFFGSTTVFGAPNPMYVVPIPPWAQIILVAGASLATWIPMSLWGPKNPPEVLRAFQERVRPPGPGWPKLHGMPKDPLLPQALRFVAGLVVVYATLFGLGELLLGRGWLGAIELVVAGAALVWILRGGRSAPTHSTGERAMTGQSQGSEVDAV